MPPREKDVLTGAERSGHELVARVRGAAPSLGETLPCLCPALLCEAPTEPPGSLQQLPQLPITSAWVPQVQSAAPHPFLLSRELPQLLFPESQGRCPAGQRPRCYMGNGGWMGK